VAVPVPVEVGVFDGVDVAATVNVGVGVSVGVGVPLAVGVALAVAVLVGVEVAVGVGLDVEVFVGVREAVGVFDGVIGVLVGDGPLVDVCVRVGVIDGVRVIVGVRVLVGVLLSVPSPPPERVRVRLAVGVTVRVVVTVGGSPTNGVELGRALGRRIPLGVGVSVMEDVVEAAGRRNRQEASPHPTRTNRSSKDKPSQRAHFLRLTRLLFSAFSSVGEKKSFKMSVFLPLPVIGPAFISGPDRCR